MAPCLWHFQMYIATYTFLPSPPSLPQLITFLLHVILCTYLVIFPSQSILLNYIDDDSIAPSFGHTFVFSSRPCGNSNNEKQSFNFGDLCYHMLLLLGAVPDDYFQIIVRKFECGSFIHILLKYGEICEKNK